MNELKEIWKQNTVWQNITWIGNTVLLFVLLPYFLIKEFLFPGEDK